MRRRTRSRLELVWAVAVTASMFAACSESSSRPEGQALSVVFISIDTLRADHVGCYGHPAGATPHIDRLAAEGTRFEVCVSSCPMTLPSHSTMMTGTYPFVHGARNNGTFVLDDENVTLAELLGEAGYATHAEIAAAVLEKQFGLSQGFDGYGDSFVDEQVRSRANRDDVVQLHDTQRDASLVTAAGLAYLESRRGIEQPFFLFLHYFDPHQPYEAPEPFAGQHGGGYLAEIAYTDNEVGRIFDILRTEAFSGRTLVVLTSDHGDGFSEHREFSHGSFLYDTTLRVPLVIWAPGRVGAGQVAAAQVGLVDLLPTILELAGTAAPERVQGTSLVPMLEDPSTDLHLETYSETFETRMTFGYSELRALYQDGWKYIHGPRPELYQVALDPGENQDQALGAPAKKDQMRATLRELISAAPELLGRGSSKDLASEDVQRLAALGYATDEGQEDEDDPHLWTEELTHFDDPSGANPVDRARDIYYLYLGLGALRDGNHEGGVKSWSAFVERNPDYAPAHSYLAQCYASLGQTDAALASLRRALELKPDRCDDYQILGSLLAEAKQLEEAREAFERALECNPDHPVAQLHLGKLLLLQGEPEGAVRALDEFLRILPENVPAQLLRAKALQAQGKPERAIDALRELLEAHPQDGSLRTELAALLVADGRSDEASALYGESLQRVPGNVTLRIAAARFWIEQGKGARALKALEVGLRTRPGNVGLEALRVQLLATDSDPAVRDPNRAEELAQSLLASAVTEDPRVLGAAASAAASLGEVERAIGLAERAVLLATQRGAEALEARLNAELAGYRAQ